MPRSPLARPQRRLVVYQYPEKFGRAAQNFAAKERKEHKEKKLGSSVLCELCVFLRPSSLAAAAAALRCIAGLQPANRRQNPESWE
jgi:hypothetical protein